MKLQPILDDINKFGNNVNDVNTIHYFDKSSISLNNFINTDFDSNYQYEFPYELKTSDGLSFIVNKEGYSDKFIGDRTKNNGFSVTDTAFTLILVHNPEGKDGIIQAKNMLSTMMCVIRYFPDIDDNTNYIDIPSPNINKPVTYGFSESMAFMAGHELVVYGYGFQSILDVNFNTMGTEAYFDLDDPELGWRYREVSSDLKIPNYSLAEMQMISSDNPNEWACMIINRSTASTTNRIQIGVSNDNRQTWTFNPIGTIAQYNAASEVSVKLAYNKYWNGNVDIKWGMMLTSKRPSFTYDPFSVKESGASVRLSAMTNPSGVNHGITGIAIDMYSRMLTCCGAFGLCFQLQATAGGSGRQLLNFASAMNYTATSGLNTIQVVNGAFISPFSASQFSVDDRPSSYWTNTSTPYNSVESTPYSQNLNLARNFKRPSWDIGRVYIFDIARNGQYLLSRYDNLVIRPSKEKYVIDPVSVKESYERTILLPLVDTNPDTTQQMTFSALVTENEDAGLKIEKDLQINKKELARRSYVDYAVSLKNSTYYTKEESDGKYVIKVTTPDTIYGSNSTGEPTTFNYSTTTTANTIVIRDNTGNVPVLTNVTGDNAIGYNQVNEMIGQLHTIQQPEIFVYDDYNTNVFTLSKTPGYIINVYVTDVDSKFWMLQDADYSISGNNLTINNPSLVSGMRIKVIYTN